MRRKAKKQKFAIILALLLFVSSVGENVTVSAQEDDVQSAEEMVTEVSESGDVDNDGSEISTVAEAEASGDATDEEEGTVTASGTCGDNLTWVLTTYKYEGGILTISGSGDMYSYTKRSAPWYDYKGDYECVVIEDGVTSIGSDAFYEDALISITIADSVTCIERYAFYDCEYLESVIIPDGVTSIEANTFDYCISLTSVTIPDSVEDIGYKAFSGCGSLTSVTIPDSVTSISSYAFYGCDSLTSVELSGNLTSMGKGAFGYCHSLTSITIPDGVTSIESSVFEDCAALTSVTIPDSVTSIGDYAFYWCVSLTSVTIPDSVTSVGDYAFSGCESLSNIRFSGDAPSIDSHAFGSVTATVMYPASADGWEDAIGNYGGTLTWVAYSEYTEFALYAEVELDQTEFTYSGSEITPAVTVTFRGETLAGGTDYSVSYSDNVDAGTATVSVEGMGDYEGTITKNFTITAQSLSSSKVSLSYTSKTYTGSAFSPSVTVKNAAGETLVEGTDYTVTTPSGRKNAGTYTYTIEGAGNYTGTVTKTLTINPVSIKTSSSAYVSCTLLKTSYTYSGSEKKPSVTLKVKVNGSTKTLSKSSSSGYTVSYKNNTKIGKATVTITGTGNYTGTITKTFKILPKKGTISSLKSSAKKKMTVKWKTISGSVTKYQVRYRVKGTSTWKTKTYSSSTKSKTITGLKSGKTYQVQVRAYKTVSGTKYYGSWSSTKTVKVK